MAASWNGRTSVERVEGWRKHVEGWKRSGLSQDAYCRKNGISKSTLGHWKRRLERDATAGNVQTVVPVPIQITTPEKKPAVQLQLRIGERYRVDIQDDFSPATLEKLLRTLNRLP